MGKNRKVNACIIGSGAGGAVVAKELGESGLSVVVLEAGKRFNPITDYNVSTFSNWERASRARNKQFRLPRMETVTLGSNNIGRPIEAYGVGGSTLRFLADYVRFLPDDFLTYTRDGVGTDWPITYEDLAPYYRSVELELGISGKSRGPWFPDIDTYINPPFEYAFHSKVLAKSFNTLGIQLWPMPVGRLSRPFNGRPACVKCGRCDYGCMIKAKASADVTYIAKAESTGHVEVRPESVVTRIKSNASGKVNSVIYIDKNGLVHEQKSDIVVVSCGTIRSPRLLLNSKSSLFPDGLANRSGLVGKNYMIHTHLYSSGILPERVDSFRGHAGAISLDYASTDKRNPFVRGFSIKPKSLPAGPAGTAIQSPGWGLSHKNFMRKNFGHMVALSALGEHLPSEINRVELDPEVVDDYGVPVPKVFLELNENDKLIVDAIERKMLEIFSTAKATDIHVKKERILRAVHHMGTCRMGNDPDTSVINSFCQSHDIKNLFVVDASCFVTGSTANPSLTIQAISKRSAEYMIDEGKKGNL